MNLKKITKIYLLVVAFVIALACNVQAATMENLFDGEYYLSQNKDVAKDSYFAQHPYQHFINFGMKEGRAPGAWFDRNYYLANNTDILGDTYYAQHPYQHFVDFGMDEGRAATPGFDVRHYVANNPDILGDAYFAQHPYEHYIRFGSKEGFRKVADHVYDQGAQTKAATCTAEGERTYTCTACGAKRVEKIGMIPHAYDEGTQTVAPTCTVEGEMTYTCANCGDERVDKIGMSAHQMNPVEEVEAVCGKNGHDGMAAYYHCATCEKNFKDEAGAEEVANLDDLKIVAEHNYNYTEEDKTDGRSYTVRPNCTTGEKGYYTIACKVCGETESDENGKPVIHEEEATHTYQEDENGEIREDRKEATCEEDGYIDRYCTTCKKVIREKLNKLNHQYGEPTFSDWSADYTSATATFVCQNDETHVLKLTATATTPEIPAQAATCTEAGYALYTATIVLDGKTYSSQPQTKTLPATGHDWDATKTRTENYGKKNVTTPDTITTRYCKNCTHSETTITHNDLRSYDPQKIVGEATCGQPAKEFQWCANCDEHDIEKEITVAHPTEKFKTITAKPATCEEGQAGMGVKETYYHCEECDKYYKDAVGKEEITDITEYQLPRLTTHTTGNLVSGTTVPCTSPEGTTGTRDHYECSVCHKYFEDKEGTVELDSIIMNPTHTGMSKRTAKAATETTDGYTVTHWHCATCNKNFADAQGNTEITEDVVIPAGHSWELVKWGSDVDCQDAIVKCTNSDCETYYNVEASVGDLITAGVMTDTYATEKGWKKTGEHDLVVRPYGKVCEKCGEILEQVQEGNEENSEDVQN